MFGLVKKTQLESISAEVSNLKERKNLALDVFRQTSEELSAINTDIRAKGEEVRKIIEEFQCIETTMVKELEQNTQTIERIAEVFGV